MTKIMEKFNIIIMVITMMILEKAQILFASKLCKVMVLCIKIVMVYQGGLRTLAGFVMMWVLKQVTNRLVRI